MSVIDEEHSGTVTSIGGRLTPAAVEFSESSLTRSSKWLNTERVRGNIDTLVELLELGVAISDVRWRHSPRH